MNRLLRATAACTALGLLLAACGQKPVAPPPAQPAAAPAPTAPAAPAAPAQPTQPAAKATQRLSIVTGGTSGVYYVYGGGLAKVLSKELPGVEATAEVTAASVENMNLINQKSADLAFTLADTAFDAANGKGQFAQKLPIQSLAVLYTNMTHLVVMADSPIQAVKDLKGKRVSTGSPNSGTELIANRTLKAAGLDPAKDITRERLGAGESAAALKDKKVDAFFWSGGLPTAAVLELANTPGVKIRIVPTDDTVASLVQEFGPLYVVATVPATAYPNVPGVKVSAVPNLLVVHKDMPESLAYDILKTMFARQDDLGAVHPEAKNLNLKTASTGASVDYHPGAIKFYKEQGVWTGK